jgi:phospholipase C
MENTKTGLDTFDLVVVLMMENRSFDNFLGFLYEDGQIPQGKKFAGLQGMNIQMPVPTRASDYTKHHFVAPLPAENYHQPYPDPGEVYQHVNTQLYNYISSGNLNTQACAMVPPYNIPDPQPVAPGMMGFINDYINTLQSLPPKDGKAYQNPVYAQYNKIMQCYTPKQLSVLTTLAKQFAVFDHWYCSVPSQTWCNRAFWHAATSGGKVQNPTDACTLWYDFEAMRSWEKAVWHEDSIFLRMKQHNISLRVYTQELISLTTLINGPFQDDDTEIVDRELNHFKGDIQNGTLRNYSFIEPRFLGVHNDQHPSSAAPGFDDGPTHTAGTVLLREALICDVYNTIFSSPRYAENTLLIITYDEHGGCFDHIPPPPVGSGTGQNTIGENGFKFDPLGVRVPMVMVSAYIQPNTIINESFEHTSFIKTVCDKWGMEGLTERDKNAKSFEQVFSGSKRELPILAAPTIPIINKEAYDNLPLNDLQQSIIKGGIL